MGKTSFKIIQESCGLGDTKNSNFISQKRKSSLFKFDAVKAGLNLRFKNQPCAVLLNSRRTPAKLHTKLREPSAAFTRDFKPELLAKCFDDMKSDAKAAVSLVKPRIKLENPRQIFLRDTCAAV